MMRISLVAAAIALSVPLSAGADGHAKELEAAVKARQAVYQVYAFNLGQLAAMAKGEKEYNAELAQNSADNLFAAVNMQNGAMWPQGSDNAGPMKGKTRALPKAWTTWPAIMDKHDALVKAATTMQASAGSLDGIRGAIGDVGASCKGCHDEYRAKDF